MSGDEPKKRSARYLTGVSYHEAAHAVAAKALGIRVDSVEIYPDDNDNQTGGICMTADPPDRYVPGSPLDTTTISQLEGEIDFLFSGWVTDIKTGADREGFGSISDFAEGIRRCEEAGIPKEQLMPMIDACKARVDKLVSRHWEAIEQLSQALQQRHKIEGVELQTLLAKVNMGDL